VGFAVAMINSGGSGGSPSVSPSESVVPTTSKSANQNTENTFAPVGDNWEDVARSVVYIEATGSACGWRGSGSIVGDGSLVLTNQHVAGDGECDLAVYLTDSTSATPTQSVRAEVVVSDSSVDLAIIQLFDSSGGPYVATGRTPLSLSAAVPKLGDKITILGYPGLGGSTITLTSGDFSGIDRSESYEYLKTTANMNPGVSGGSAFNSAKQLVGIPTAGRGAEIACDGNTDCVANGSTIGLLRPVSLAQQILTRANSKLGK
jgi:S1-C subfamily serine protease